MSSRRAQHCLVVAGVAATLVALPLVAVTASRQAPPSQPADTPSPTSIAEVETLCGSACHRLPPPDSLPRAAWHDTIARMSLLRAGDVETKATFDAHRASMPADMRRALAYYEARSPEALAPPDSWPLPDLNQTPRFERRAVAVSGVTQPGVSHLELADIAGDGRLELIVTDMRYGRVLAHRPYVPGDGFVELGQVPHPAQTTVTDLDGDGLKDLLVADLGSFLPADHAHGAVIWMRGRPRYAPFVSAPVATGLPRAAAVAAADFDDDARVDLAVAAFGWRTTGRLLFFRQQQADTASPGFDVCVLDERTGAVDVVAADINGDGRRDIVALFAQEHETVVAYVNDGGGRFRQETIYAAPHPIWGSSDLDVVDLDGDGDLDVVLAHGDMFDDLIIKPYHGIQWLENRRTFPFEPHTLASLPGALRAHAADLDGDGDLDVVAVAMVHGDSTPGTPLASIVWLEQVQPGRFIRHTLETGMAVHAALAVGDFDLDGDVDIVVGYFSNGGRELPASIEVWENTTK
jgi:hypothetical protein